MKCSITDVLLACVTCLLECYIMLNLWNTPVSLYLSHSLFAFFLSSTHPVLTCYMSCYLHVLLHLSVMLSTCLTLCLFHSLPVWLSACVALCLALYLSQSLPVSLCLFHSLPVLLSACLTLYLSYILPVSLFACVFVSPSFNYCHPSSLSPLSLFFSLSDFLSIYRYPLTESPSLPYRSMCCNRCLGGVNDCSVNQRVMCCFYNNDCAAEGSEKSKVTWWNKWVLMNSRANEDSQQETSRNAKISTTRDS